MQARKQLLPLLLLTCLAITSCVEPLPKSFAAIDGNWHVAGEQGTLILPLLQSPLLTFAMGANGTALYAKGNIGVNCPNGGAIGGAIELTGQIASDGTFVLSNASEPLDSIQVSIRGTVPADGATSWPGSYTITNAATETGCTFNDSSSFVAGLYPPLNGTYAGTITGPGFGSGINIAIQITQGTFTSAMLGSRSPAVFYTPLSSTITVSGSPIFTSGTTTTNPAPALAGSINGNAFNLNYVMNNGSALALSGLFTDSSESTLQVVLLPAFGSTGSGGSNICTLTLQ